MSSTSPATAVRERLRNLAIPHLGTILLLVVAYVPLLLTRPGEVGADTKTYLYLDPARLLSRAAWMWDTNIGLGTVTHQNIGYLWPMGPWYWVMDAIGFPDWVAQRLWLGTLIAAAGLGVRFMLRELRWEGPGLTVASFAYALSPFLLHYGARISVILLPFAGLPWLIALASRSLRRGGWRWPAVFALVTLTVGGVNATSLILVMAGPLLWFLHATFVAHEVSLKRAIATGLRISALTLVTSLWWIAGLSVQGTYGIPILRYTETYYVVAHAALSTEVMRGLGYWFFYGRDALGAWIEPAERMVQSIPALVVSFKIPGLALVSGFLTRFRNRGFFALLVATGLVIAIGSHPWEESTPAGAVFKAWTRSDAGLAFRSTPRAVPLVALGLAVMLAAAVAALSAWKPPLHLPAAGVVLALVLVNQWALFAGEMVDRNLRRDEELPEYWSEAAAAMDAGATTEGGGTRVYEMPGTDFASYRWGNTVDPITPGLMDRPFVARELIPYGTPASANLLNAVDAPLQQDSFDPRSLVPVSQLMGVGTVAHRGDLQYERFRTPRPRNLWHMLTGTEGLAEPVAFGEGIPNEASAKLPLDDEVYFGTPAAWPDAPAVSLFDLEDPRPIVRTVSASTPTVMAGDGAGIVDWAATGGLDPDRAILYSASFAEDPDALDDLLDTPGSQLVVTDTNRRAARRWGSVRENDGYTERVGEEPLEKDPADNRLDLFPGAGDDSYTVTEQVGSATLSASNYGNPVSYTPSDRALHAMDGDPATAWRVGAFDEPRGEYLEVVFDDPVSPGEITLLQTQRQANRWITGVDLSFDGGEAMSVALDDSSRSQPGQRIDVGDRTFSTLRVTIAETNIGRLDRYTGVSDVGIAELGVVGVEPVGEVVRPPTDLLDASGEASIDHSLSYVFTRRRANPAEVVVEDEESQLRRLVEGPVTRGYQVFGTARLAADLPAQSVDRLLGMPSLDEGGVQVSSSAQLAGDPLSRATSALDGDPATAWQTPVNASDGQWILVESPEPLTFDEVGLTVVRDGRHSVPTRIKVQVDDGEPVVAEVIDPGVGERGERGAVEELSIPVPPQSGKTVRVTIEAVEEAASKDWFGGSRTVLPVGIAELDVGAVVDVPEADSPIPSECREDLLTLDGQPVPARVEGTVGEALAREALDLVACGDGVGVDAGSSMLESVPGSQSGFDVDQVVLASAPGGGPGRDTAVEGPEPVDPPPSSEGSNPSRLTWDVDVEGATDPYWVVLGQSLSPGFRAVAGDGTDLGESTLVNGYANGWLVDPAEVGTDTTITITWPPQRNVWIALALSGLGVLLCAGFILGPPRLLAGQPLPGPFAPMAPTGVAPLGVEGSPLRRGRVTLVALGFAALTFVLAGWAVALAAGVLVAAALGFRRGQVLMRIVGVALFGMAAGFVVAKQWHYGFMVDFNWMNQFEVTHAWTLTAVALLVADPLVTHLRSRVTPAVVGLHQGR
jgi:arabinofuranan 3-O-arabinosyltransferase